MNEVRRCEEMDRKLRELQPCINMSLELTNLLSLKAVFLFRESVCVCL